MEDNLSLVLVYAVGVVCLCHMYSKPDDFDLSRFQIAMIIIFWPLVMVYITVCLLGLICKDIWAFICS